MSEARSVESLEDRRRKVQDIRVAQEVQEIEFRSFVHRRGKGCSVAARDCFKRT